jgi:hypothetical protein
VRKKLPDEETAGAHPHRSAHQKRRAIRRDSLARWLIELVAMGFANFDRAVEQSDEEFPPVCDRDDSTEWEK